MPAEKKKIYIVYMNISLPEEDESYDIASYLSQEKALAHAAKANETFNAIKLKDVFVTNEKYYGYVDEADSDEFRKMQEENYNTIMQHETIGDIKDILSDYYADWGGNFDKEAMKKIMGELDPHIDWIDASSFWDKNCCIYDVRELELND